MILAALLLKFASKKVFSNLVFYLKLPIALFLRSNPHKIDHVFLLNTLMLICLIFSIKMAKCLIICGDVEINPGDTFDFMQWNCNSLVAHQYSRIPLIEAYSSLHKLQIIALCETALKPEHNNTDIEIDGYSIIRNDLPVGDSHGGVMIYHKNDLAVKHRIDIQSLSNTIVLELSISKKNVFLF